MYEYSSNIMTNILYCLIVIIIYKVRINYFLLENYNEKIDLFIIHDDPPKFEKLAKIKGHKNLNSFNIYKFQDKQHNFPNLNEAHVTYATYFRMFINKYLPINLDYIIYIDPDIVCLKDPSKELEKVIRDLKSSKYSLAALTEGVRETSTLFDSLSLKGEKYFNAGMIIIDYKDWLKRNTGKELIKIMKENFNNIKYWDQDVMNKYFDGNYIEIPRSLNYTSSDGISLSDENIYLLHYAGSKKPWYFGFVFNKISKHYQEAYQKLFKNKYHVTLNLKKHEVPQLISVILSKELKFFDKIKFIYGILKTRII